MQSFAPSRRISAGSVAVEQSTHIYVYICIYIYIYIYIHTYTHIHVYIYIYIHTHTHMYIHYIYRDTYISIYLSISLSLSIYIYIWTILGGAKVSDKIQLILNMLDKAWIPAGPVSYLGISAPKDQPRLKITLRLNFPNSVNFRIRLNITWRLGLGPSISAKFGQC